MRGSSFGISISIRLYYNYYSDMILVLGYLYLYNSICPTVIIVILGFIVALLGGSNLEDPLRALDRGGLVQVQARSCQQTPRRGTPIDPGEIPKMDPP